MVLPQWNLLRLITGWLIPCPAACCYSTWGTSGLSPAPLLPWPPASMELLGIINQTWFAWNQPKGSDNVWEAGETQARRQWSNTCNFLRNAGKKLMPQGRISLKSWFSFMCSVVLWASQSWLSFKGEGVAESFFSLKHGELNGSSPLFADEGVKHCHLPLHFSNGYRFMQKEGTTLPFFLFFFFLCFTSHFPQETKVTQICVSMHISLIWGRNLHLKCSYVPMSFIKNP